MYGLGEEPSQKPTNRPPLWKRPRFLGRLAKAIVFLALLTYFAIIVSSSIGRLNAKRVGIAPSVKTVKKVIYPSISVCPVRWKEVTFGTQTLGQLNERKTLNETLIKLEYSQILDNGTAVRTEVNRNNMLEVDENLLRIQHVLFPSNNASRGSVFACVTFDPPGPSPLGNENNVEIQVNSTNRVLVFALLYNHGQLHLPNQNKLYGSTYRYLECRSRVDKTNLSGITEFRQDFEVEQIHWRAIDHTKHRCLENGKGNITSCVKSYVEKSAGCSLDGRGNKCNTTDHYSTMSQLQSNLGAMDDNDIYDSAGGCLVSCNHSEFRIKALGDLQEIHWPLENGSGQKTTLRFRYASGRVLIKEQYLLYGPGDVFADVGGYLGLLLGQSIFTIFESVVDLCVASHLDNSSHPVA